MKRSCWRILILVILAISLLSCDSGSEANDIIDGDEDNATDGDVPSDGDNELMMDGDEAPDGDLPLDGDDADSDPELEGEDEVDWSDSDLLGDIDGEPCPVRSCGVQARCLWTGGEQHCECYPGYAGDPYDECNDIDECGIDNAGCDPLTECHNEIGSFWCGPCPEEGYMGNPSIGCEPILNEHQERFTIGATGLFIPLYRNYPLTEVQEGIEHAVIVIHGTSRNADDYYLRMYHAVRKANLTPSTLVISPRFMIAEDTPAVDEFYWDENSEWKIGDYSSDQLASRVSSFTVIDKLIETLGDIDLFPAMKHILIAGHSAGGQFVQRFAAGSAAEDATDIPLRYAVANPSSYLYLNNQRIVADSLDTFAVPETDCTGYNDYKYGLENLNPYMANVGAAQIPGRYLGRDLLYLLGEDDIDQAGDSLDLTCPAMLQGAQRLERGTIFYNYLAYYIGSAIHDKVIVPGVAHDSDAIFNSDEGVQAMFGWME